MRIEVAREGLSNIIYIFHAPTRCPYQYREMKSRLLYRPPYLFILFYILGFIVIVATKIHHFWKFELCTITVHEITDERMYSEISVKGSCFTLLMRSQQNQHKAPKSQDIYYAHPLPLTTLTLRNQSLHTEAIDYSHTLFVFISQIAGCTGVRNRF